MTWSGLGYHQHQPYGGYSHYLSTAQYTENDKWGPLFANAFPRMRMIVDYSSGAGGIVYPNTHSQSLHIWYEAVKRFNPNLYVLFGITNNIASVTDRPDLSTFIPSAYTTYRTYMLAEAQWAQDNLVDAFCIGNENLISTAHANAGMVPTSITRASNVATATFSYNHGLTTGDYIFVSGGSDASYRVADTESGETVQCTVVSPTVITYPSTGSDGTATGSYKVNWSAYEVIRKTKALGAAAQAVFTRGPIVYSESQGHTTCWRTIGITPGTDIDLWGLNGYGTVGGDLETTTNGYDSWKAELDACWGTFGTDMIITEFNCVQDSGNHKVGGLDKRDRGYEVNHAKEMTRRLNYVKSLGVEQCYYFSAAEGPMFYARDYVSTWNLAYLKNGSNYRQVYNAMREEAMDRLFLGKGFAS